MVQKTVKKTNIRTARLEELKEVYKLDRQAFKRMNYPSFVIRQFYDLSPDLLIVAVSDNDEIFGYILGGDQR